MLVVSHSQPPHCSCQLTCWNMDSNVMSTLKTSHIAVQICPLLRFLALKTCLYYKIPQHYDSFSSDLIIKFLGMRVLGKLYNAFETTKQDK